MKQATKISEIETKARFKNEILGFFVGLPILSGVYALILTFPVWS